MADEVKVSKFGNARKSVTRSFKEIRSELKRVIWPTKEQLIKNTVTVLAACLVVGVIIWIADFAFGAAFRFLLNNI